MQDKVWASVTGYSETILSEIALRSDKSYMQALQDLAEYRVMEYNCKARELFDYAVIFDRADFVPCGDGVKYTVYFEVVER